ncbi:hypothetical protein B0J13DRAFT_649309 [Dactylonectria estremocensis]|uniref:Uncharacterized protein n=1 Tax=Dactylonectria estremocensis TaxID=1079267 RepID=A0A9P9IHT0_9HYPO|nr:hypothetical protein B0J13DRAFT_649309 [Dactylonectria estremocensis]
MEPIRIMSIYPITIGIMDALSASDVSAFLHATRLYRMFTKEFLNKYMHLERHMPSIRYWLERKGIGDHTQLGGSGRQCEYATPSPMKFIHDPTYDCHGMSASRGYPSALSYCQTPTHGRVTNIYQSRMGAHADVPNGNEKRVAARFHNPLKYPLGIFSGYMDEKYKMRNRSGDMVESVSPLEVVNMLTFVFQDCGLGPVESTYFTMPIYEPE